MEDRYYSDIVLYSDVESHETYLELWGASTKHPDSMHRYSYFQTCPYNDTFEYNCYQWLCEIASKTMWRETARRIIKFANEIDVYYFGWLMRKSQ